MRAPGQSVCRGLTRGHAPALSTDAHYWMQSCMTHMALPCIALQTDVPVLESIQTDVPVLESDGLITRRNNKV